MKIRATPQFERQYKKLPPEVKERAKERERIFISDPFEPRLETHKLHGKDKEKWAYSIDYQYRIKFIFLGGKKILYCEIGTHDEIYR